MILFSGFRDKELETNLIQKGYSKTTLNHKIHSYLTLPFFLFLMVVLASIFTLTPAINTQNVKLSFIAIITCVVTYYLNDLSLVLGKTNKVPMVLAIWIPILLSLIHISEPTRPY